MTIYKYPWMEKQAKRKAERKVVASRPMRTGTPIAKKSKKLSANEKIYAVLRKDFMKDNPACKAGLSNCTKKATEIHHKKGRGILLNEVKYFLPVCSTCHKWIELHPKEAVKEGLSVLRLSKD